MTDISRSASAFIGARCPVLLASAAISTFSTQPVLAQSLDYGRFEEIFGEPVTTSATGKPQKASEVPANMEILTQDDIRRSGATTVADALQFVTGLNFKKSSVNDPEVSIRGYNQPWNPRLLLLIDGRPVYEDFYGDVIWSAIPVQLDEIRQIEVVKGPNSALFGFNAASGVINIVTFDPVDDSTNAVTVRGGTQSLVEGGAVATLHTGPKSGIRLSVGGMGSQEFPSGNLFGYNPTVELQRTMNGSFNADSRWQLTDTVVLSLQGSAVHAERNFPSDGTPENDRSGDARMQLTANTGLGEITADGYWTRWNIDYQPVPANAYFEEAWNTVYDLRIGDLFKLGARHSIRLSAEFKDNSAGGQFLNGDSLDAKTYAASGMWNWEINEALTLTNSVRADTLRLGWHGALAPNTGLTVRDYSHASLTAVSYNSGLVSVLTDADVVRVMLGRGFQLPSLNDFGQQIPNAYSSPGLYAIGNPNLKPMAVDNIEVDYDHKVDGLFSTLRSAVYAQRNSNLLGFDSGSPSLPSALALQYPATSLSQTINIGRSNEVGVEFGLKGSVPEGWRWNASYVYAALKDHLYPGVAQGVYASFDQETPKHTIVLGVGYAIGDWEFDTQGKWQSSYVDFVALPTFTYQPELISSLVTVNARIGYRPTAYLTLSTTVEQLNQDFLYERPGTPVQRRVIGSLTARF